MKVHFLEKQLAESTTPLTITVIGAGGTGSRVIEGLIRMNLAFIQLNMQPIMVKLYDADLIEMHNMGRSAFFPNQEGMNKAVSLITTVNMNFGFNWKGYPYNLNRSTSKRKEIESKDVYSNIYISCVDDVKNRKEILYVSKQRSSHWSPSMKSYYLIDIGNEKDFGQVLLSTTKEIEQPISKYETVSNLPDVFEKFGMKEDNRGNIGSCSMFESLEKQDLLINPLLANYAIHLLWNLLRKKVILYSGIFLNLETLKTNPIKL